MLNICLRCFFRCRRFFAREAFKRINNRRNIKTVMATRDNEDAVKAALRTIKVLSFFFKYFLFTESLHITNSLRRANKYRPSREASTQPRGERRSAASTDARSSLWPSPYKVVPPPHSTLGAPCAGQNKIK